MRKAVFWMLGLVVVPLLALSTSTAPMGYGLSYWVSKHGVRTAGMPDSK